jgi:hypothetical protein
LWWLPGALLLLMSALLIGAGIVIDSPLDGVLFGALPLAAGTVILWLNSPRRAE